ncbi:MAG: Ig-like domain-containing surface protein [Bacteroidales bacterium]|nr:Ig-like domain-containing surface protein [Bacteroidales bacterium]
MKKLFRILLVSMALTAIACGQEKPIPEGPDKEKEEEKDQPEETRDPRSYLDPSGSLSAKLTKDIIFSKKVLLAAPRNIMQGFDITADGKVYYSQSHKDKVTMNLCMAAGPNQDASASYMSLYGFGHGTQFVAEKNKDGKTYIWCNSNAALVSGEANDNLTFSRFPFRAGAQYENCAGENFVLNKPGHMDLQVSVDFECRRLLIGTRIKGKSIRYFWIYDLDKVMALPIKDMKITVDWEGEKVRTIKARDLSSLETLGYFEIPRGKNADTDVYYYSHQGHEIYGNYIYFYEGNAVEKESGSDTYDSVAYVTIFDYKGNIIMKRTKVGAISDASGLNDNGMTFNGYAEGESLKIKNGKLYLGVACRNESSGSNRYANILVYDTVEKRH